MKILFLARHFTYFRNYESVIRLLAERGHTIHLAVERGEALGGLALVERLAADHPRVTFGEAPARERDEWAPLATRLRLAFDVVRYLDPIYDGAPKLRARAADRAPAFAIRFADSAWSRRGAVRACLRHAVRLAESGIPASAAIEAYLREQAPDVLLVTPLIGVVGSPQPDYVRAAQRLGMPVGLCVWSWDHLSSKALIRDLPDRVFVWNEVQRDEAWRFHRVPADRVVVTGAQCFDQWFGRTPSRTRAEFCRRAGLPAEKPYVLYVGSALFGGSPSEAAFVRRWIDRLRASGDPAVRSAAVLVRPHPQRLAEWDDVDLSAVADVAVWGGNPVNDQARADYFDALFHSAAVVGLNTSAFLEAAIVGRPVLAIAPAEFRENQDGTLHFRHLTEVAGGVLRVGRTLDEHDAQLQEALAGPADAARHERFVEAFIRPRGLQTPATPGFVDAVASMAAMTLRRPERQPSLAARAARRAVAALARSRRYAHWFMDAEDRRAQAWRDDKARARAAQRRAGLDDEGRADAEAEMRSQRKIS